MPATLLLLLLPRMLWYFCVCMRTVKNRSRKSPRCLSFPVSADISRKLQLSRCWPGALTAVIARSDPVGHGPQGEGVTHWSPSARLPSPSPSPYPWSRPNSAERAIESLAGIAQCVSGGCARPTHLAETLFF